MVTRPAEPTKETMPTLQQPRLKPSSRATPSTMERVQWANRTFDCRWNSQANDNYARNEPLH
eukprot:1048853-Amphidinium_carterae.3